MRLLTLFAAGLLTAGPAFCKDLHITPSSQPGAFPLVAPGNIASIVIDSNDAPVVGVAADAVAGDMKLITGKEMAVVNSVQTGTLPVIAGTIGDSELIDALIKSKKIKVKDIKGKWETFLIQVVENPMPGVSQALVVAGSDPRGTAFGLFELSRLAGVSPYVWWADVIPEARESLYVSGDPMTSKEPSVQFRGMFINDEDFGLNPWAAKKMDPERKNIGPNTYAKVAELLLRLRANTLWPAMHACTEAFWANPENVEVARKYDLVLGSSHCEQMLRDNEWEWRKQGLGEKEWNWKTNRKMVQDYWTQRVGESRGIDAMYTLGMRGVHDTGMNGYTDEDRVQGLSDVIAWQRQLLADSIGDPTKVPQIFIPYKEVLEAYNDGLKVPEDVTLCWVDDNHGYIRQMPTPEEQKRSGGNGMYYHLSYLGTPVPWCWLSSVSPTLASFELTKAYDNNAKKLWIINVGDIKPQEADFEFCMDLAYDIDSYPPETAYRYTRDWAARTFGEEFADDIADIRRVNYRLSSAGKPEHIYRVPYSIKEQNARIAEYERAIAKIDSLRPYIPERLQNAYYELVTYPVKAAGWMNRKVFRDQQSEKYAKAGMKDEAVNAYNSAASAYISIHNVTDHYNRNIAGGKWDGIVRYLPWGHGPAYKMPTDFTDSVATVRTPLDLGRETVVKGGDYNNASKTVKAIEGLGTSDYAATVWPLDYKAYKANELAKTPFVEYSVPVKKGRNKIDVRCLSSFPLNPNYDLRVGVAVADVPAEVISVKTEATKGKWHETSIAGHSPATLEYDSDKDGEVNVKVYLMDPGVVVNDIVSTPL